MGKRLERFGEVRIVDEINGFGLDFVKKAESGIWGVTPYVGVVSMCERYFMIPLKQGSPYKKNCVAYSISSLAETRDKALSFFLGKRIS